LNYANFSEYKTREQALEIGAFYAGYSDAADRKRVIAEATIDTLVLGWPQEKKLTSYEILNKDGIKVLLGIGEFRDGYDLWLISANGFAQRT